MHCSSILKSPSFQVENQNFCIFLQQPFIKRKKKNIITHMIWKKKQPKSTFYAHF